VIIVVTTFVTTTNAIEISRLKKIFPLLLTLHLLWSCGDNNYPDISGTPKLSQNQQSSLTPASANNLANAFCASQNTLQIVATSFLSVYSVMGNGSDLNYCGGTLLLNKDGLNFDISMTDYCVNAAGQEVIINGGIDGMVETGGDFSSNIYGMRVVSDGIDLSVSGNTWNGRADEQFMRLNIIDNMTATKILIEEASLKNGEFDYGYITFPDLGRFEFRFIANFNADLSQGQVYIYADSGQAISITATNGGLAVIYNAAETDPGVTLNSTIDRCN